MTTIIMRFTISFLLLIFMAVSSWGQCILPISCTEILEEHHLESTVVDSVYAPSQFVFCAADQPSIFIDKVYFTGQARVFYLSINVPEDAINMISSAWMKETKTPVIQNIYTHEDCTLSEYKNYENDFRNQIVNFGVIGGEELILEVIIPENIEGDSIVISTQSFEELRSCEDANLSGTNPHFIFEIVDRSIADYEGVVFFPGEEVHVRINYIFDFPAESTPDWLHSIFPNISNGWEYNLDDISVTTSSGIQELDVPLVNSDPICGLRSNRDLGFFCTYIDATGAVNLCNMLTEICPCDENSVEQDSPLPTAWAFSRANSNCESTCSPSDAWGSGFTSTSITIDMMLKVKEDYDGGRDLSIGITNFSDAVTGCYNPNYSVCISPLTNWSPAWKSVDRNSTYGYMSVANDTICKDSSFIIDVTIENTVETIYVDILDEAEPDIVLERFVIQSDTTLDVNISNTSDVKKTVRAILHDGSETFDFQSLVLLPKLIIQADPLSLCFNGCGQQFISLNHDHYDRIVWSTGLEDSDFSFICASDSDSISVIVEVDNCDADTILLDISISEEITVTTDHPITLCKNGEESDTALDRNFIIPIISGGSSPYIIDWNFNPSQAEETTINGQPAIEVFEESVFGNDFVYSFAIIDAQGCATSTTNVVPFLDDEMIELGEFCRDSIFDINNPTIVARLPDFSYKEIESVSWLRITSLIEGIVVNDSTFIVNEEKSTFTDQQEVPLRAQITFTDGCMVNVDYTFKIVENEPDFSFSRTDFEVDFTPASLLSVDSILWDFDDGTSSNDFFPTHIYQETGTYNVTMTLFTACDTFRITKTFMINGVSTEDLNTEFDLSIFPNPSDGNINITLDNGTLRSVNIYNIHGIKVRKEIINQNKTMIDLLALPKGLYVLEIETNIGLFYRKVLLVGNS